MRTIRWARLTRGLAVVMVLLTSARGDEPTTTRDDARDELGWRTQERPKPSSYLYRGPLAKGSLSRLIEAPSVQKELGLTNQQETELRKIARTSGTQRMVLIRRLRTPSTPGYDPERIRSEMDASRNEMNEKVLQQLTPKQGLRLQQIAYQQGGILALSRPEVARKINLDPIHAEAIRSIFEEEEVILDNLHKQYLAQRELLPKKDGIVDLKDKKVEERFVNLMKGEENRQKQIRRSNAREIGKLLTRGQKNAFNRLLGNPFDLRTLTYQPKPKPQPNGPPGDADREDHRSRSSGSSKMKT